MLAVACVLSHAVNPISKSFIMHVSPTLLLMLLAIFVLTPSIQEWINQGGTAWYRPYIIWLGAIVLVYWSQRRSSTDEF